MKSFCIKNNNEVILNYLLAEINEINMKNVFVSKSKFRLYKNIIVHYTGEQEDKFMVKLCNIITSCIVKYYELSIVKQLIRRDYFYFSKIEKNCIFNNCIDLLNDVDVTDFSKRKEKIFVRTLEYVRENKFFILDGFVNFRLFEYRNILTEAVDMAVNKFIIDKEYKEFIQLLREYINSQPSHIGVVHVIYSNGEPIILDEKENIISYGNNFIQPKYLSDISFSSKDYCLNELLNLLPEKIILHMLVDFDDFANTLQLIFKGRIMVCKECNICKTFNLIQSNI